MRLSLLAAALFALAPAARAQKPTPPDSARRDSTQRADSLEKARQDSILLVKELERIQNEPHGVDVPAPTAAPQGTTGGAQGPTNPRMLPDFSAVGDLVGDLSPKRTTQEDGSRLGIREVELAVQAVVDPYFRGDVFLGINDVEGLAIEQAYLTTTSLPYSLEARAGRFLMPVGKQNTTHRHDLHTVEYPWVIQRFFGPEGLKGTGAYLSKVLSPFGYYQEVIVTAVDRFGERPDSLTTAEPVNRRLSGLAYSARLRNYWDMSEATNLELSATALTGRREQPLDLEITPGVNATSARQTVVGVDATWRWRPLQQGLYRSFIVQGELMRQVNERVAGEPIAGTPDFSAYLGPNRDFTGGYVFSRWQLTQRAFLGARYDQLQDPERDGASFSAASGYLEFFPSEFSKITTAYERVMPDRLTATNRLLIQASFSLGPHKPHPF